MFKIFKMFTHDVKVLSHNVVQMLKGNNNKREIPTLIVMHDPIDKMVEKEMAQLKLINEERREKEMSKYKERFTSLEEVKQVIEALETLGKEYTVTKKIKYGNVPITKDIYPISVWDIEELETSKMFTNREEIVKLVCQDCGTSITGKRISLEGKNCIHNVTHKTILVPLG